MRIGIDGSCLSNRRGFGRFARRLIDALARVGSPHEFVVFLDRPSVDAVSLPPQFESVIVDVSEAPSRAAAAQGRRRIGDMLAMGRAVARSRIDLMYFPATYSFFPVWNVGGLVVTMHDTLPFSHPELVFPTRSGRLAWWLKEALATHRADRIVTVSEASRRAIEEWLRQGGPPVRAITEGPSPIFQPRPDDVESRAALARHGLRHGERYWLYVGGLAPHKNLVRLVEAFARGRAATEGRLILTGETRDVFHSQVPEIRAAIDRHGLLGRVAMTGFVPDEDLVHLYNRAYALVQPSLLEGFGLPAVEAMACGTPVVSSRAGSLPEVIGEAGVYFDPLNIGSIAQAIEDLNDDTAWRDALARRALERSKRFTWEASARMLLECFDELGPAPRRAARLRRGA